MRWSSAVLGVMALTLVGCGSTAADKPAASSSAPGVESCVTNSVIDASRTLAPVDLAGSGAPAGVNFYVGSGDCKNLLLATLDGKVRALETPVDLSLGRVSVRAITVPGRKGQLLLAVAKHPRGGFQVYLFGYAAGKLAQLTLHGRPVVPFVATDTGTQLATHCSRNGIQVDTAKFRSGSWTVFRTTYAIAGTEVTSKGRKVERSGLDDAKLEQQYSSLSRHDLFEDCG
jgi:hypothetical protein